MRQLSIHPKNPQERLVRQVAQVFDDGRLVIFPTGAGYSVGCDALNKKAVGRLYRLNDKKRKHEMTLIVPDFASMADFAVVETTAYRYMKDKLPGPYTFILPSTKYSKKNLAVNRLEIGIRLPDYPFLNTFSRLYGRALLSFSATSYEHDFLLDPQDIENKLNGQVDLLVNVGTVPLAPTTVISLTGRVPEVIRTGEGRRI
jgi:tRNA threonylcarbamoyl adenosine modification protein (Sua5/YciO/YrdC/YwlC family)